MTPGVTTPAPVHVVLVGMMATGKSSVGRVVADALARPLLDSDDQIEARTGLTVREIWHRDGETAFRRLEAKVLADALDSDTPAVIAAAGGVVLAAENRERLVASSALVIWLRARPDTLLARLEDSGDTHRPLLDEDPAGTLERMYQDRAPLYREVADDVVDVDDVDAETVAAQVLEVVRR